MFSSSSLVKLIVFEKQKTGKTNKNRTNTEELSTVAAICGAILCSLDEDKRRLSKTIKTLTDLKTLKNILCRSWTVLITLQYVAINAPATAMTQHRRTLSPKYRLVLFRIAYYHTSLRSICSMYTVHLHSMHFLYAWDTQKKNLFTTYYMLYTM